MFTQSGAKPPIANNPIEAFMHFLTVITDMRMIRKQNFAKYFCFFTPLILAALIVFYPRAVLSQTINPTHLRMTCSFVNEREGGLVFAARLDLQLSDFASNSQTGFESASEFLQLLAAGALHVDLKSKVTLFTDRTTNGENPFDWDEPGIDFDRIEVHSTTSLNPKPNLVFEHNWGAGVPLQLTVQNGSHSSTQLILGYNDISPKSGDCRAPEFLIETDDANKPINLAQYRIARLACFEQDGDGTINNEGILGVFDSNEVIRMTYQDDERLVEKPRDGRQFISYGQQFFHGQTNDFLFSARFYKYEKSTLRTPEGVNKIVQSDQTIAVPYLGYKSSGLIGLGNRDHNRAFINFSEFAEGSVILDVMSDSTKSGWFSGFLENRELGDTLYLMCMEFYLVRYQ